MAIRAAFAADTGLVPKRAGIAKQQPVLAQEAFRSPLQVALILFRANKRSMMQISPRKDISAEIEIPLREQNKLMPSLIDHAAQHRRRLVQNETDREKPPQFEDCGVHIDFRHEFLFQEAIPQKGQVVAENLIWILSLLEHGACNHWEPR